MDKSKKKKTLLIVISALIVAIIAAVLYIIFGVIGIDGKVEYRQSEKVNANVSGSNVTVLDNNVNYQTINGFGASACWSAARWPSSSRNRASRSPAPATATNAPCRSGSSWASSAA